MRKLLVGLSALAILASTPALASDTCVRRNDIRAWSSPVRKQLILENYAHRKVLLKLNGTCSGFGVYDSFQISGPLESNASCIVAGDIVRTNWAGEPGVCSIVSITPYDAGAPAKPPTTY